MNLFLDSELYKGTNSRCNQPHAYCSQLLESKKELRRPKWGAYIMMNPVVYIMHVFVAMNL